jgi:hypothetical protein
LHKARIFGQRVGNWRVFSTDCWFLAERTKRGAEMQLWDGVEWLKSALADPTGATEARRVAYLRSAPDLVNFQGSTYDGRRIRQALRLVASIGTERVRVATIRLPALGPPTAQALVVAATDWRLVLMPHRWPSEAPAL